MIPASTYGKRFDSLLRRIRSHHRSKAPEPAEPITQMILAFLEWNASRRAARGAHRRLMENFVDTNELRVTHPHEVAGMIGRDYPFVEERSTRMHESMHEIFQREQAVSLDSLKKRGKKDVRTYLDSLAGMPPYVAAQITLYCFDGHAVPIDDRLAELLREAEVVEPEEDIPQIESFLERRIKADHALDTHATLMAWVDAGTRRVAANGEKKRTAAGKKKKNTTKTTSKKKTTRR